MNVKSPTRTAMTRLIPPLTVWAIGKILELPGLQDGVVALDSHARRQGRDVARSLRRGIRNAKANIPWLAAGAVAITVGVVLMARATRGK
jgi:hypothetical protein